MMVTGRHRWRWSFLALGLVLCSAGQLQADEAQAAGVRLGALSLQVPGDWKQEQPKSRMRLGQFRIPAAQADQPAAELAVFSFGAGGGVDANLRRWVDQFQPEGREVEITTGESPQGQYYWVSLTGTYKKSVGPPILRKTTPVPGSGMLAVIVDISEKGLYFLKMVGPQATVHAQADALRASFGGQADSEKPYALQGN